LAETVDPTIADAIVRVREERLNVVPGYDGVYGQIEIIDESEKKTDESRDEQQLTQQVTRRETRKQTGQKRLADFI
jgi:PHP family Zn ribbon phosphoesterase